MVVPITVPRATELLLLGEPFSSEDAQAWGIVRAVVPGLILAIGNRYDPATPSISQFLPSVGRGLFIYPVYGALKKQGEWGVAIIRRDYPIARPGYHPTVVARLDTMLDWKAPMSRP